jgi:DNA-binding XRE family transcriptional regulator
MVDYLPTLRAAAKITQNQMAKKVGHCKVNDGCY